MPTSRRVKKVILSLIPEGQGVIYELGSGWGHLIFPLACRFPSRDIRAVEGSPIPWLVSKGIEKIVRYPNLKIERENFFTISLEEASGVVCYLYPGAMKRLKQKFQEELKPGSFIISHTFAIPGWKPQRVIVVNDLWHSQLYLYKKY